MNFNLTDIMETERTSTKRCNINQEERSYLLNITPPNTDKNCNLANVEAISNCKICGFQSICGSVELVSHYINKHPAEEVYIPITDDQTGFGTSH